jgi:hypothetical protein
LLIARCPEASAWSIEEADAWWGRHERSQASPSGPAPATLTGNAASTSASSSGTGGGPPSKYAVTIDHG